MTPITPTDGPAPTTPAGRRILSAAAELFYDQGVTRVGVDLVAERAGTTKKTLYDRFGSKEGLVLAYLEDRAARWQRHARDHLDQLDQLDQHGATPAPPGPDRPLALLDALETWMDRSARGCGFVNAYAELAGTSERALVAIRAEKDWVRAAYGALAAAGGHADPDPLGRRLALVHEGAIVSATAGGSVSAFADARDVMRQLLGVVPAAA